jgi:PKD repeat protein
MRKRIVSAALCWRVGRFLIALAVVVSAGLAAGAASAAVVGAAPTWPIPADVQAGPPQQIPALAAAGATPPPTDQIADPVAPTASCGDWQLQTNYANKWPAGASWWEYQCADEQYSSGGNNCTGTGACDAFCPSCWDQSEDRTDYFYWNGSQPVFYGEYYSYFFEYTQTGDPPSETTAWWDADAAHDGSAAQWYVLGPFPLNLSTSGAGDGSFGLTPDAGFGCGSGCLGSFDAGTVVTLTAYPGPGSVFAGWSGDCSGTGSCQLTMSQARSVTATFVAGSFALTVSRQGAGAGQVSSSPGGIGCGSGCQASFGPGTVVTLTATPDAGSLFAGWSGDCSGTGGCRVTMSQARSVTATFAPNLPPHASFTLTCTGLNCTFDGRGSSDPDDGIASYAWNFGDGSSPLTLKSGSPVPHTYPKTGSYTVTLTVTDNAGASVVSSKAFHPISVSARAYRQNGTQKVGLSWTGASATSFDVYRNGSKVASLQAFTYTDTVTRKGSLSYKVCVRATSVCSNTASVSF